MPCVWELSQIKHNGLYQELIVELVENEIFIDGEKILTDDGKIKVVLDIADHNLEKFEFKNLDIESIVFDKEETVIILRSKINASKGDSIDYTREREYFPIINGQRGKDPMPSMPIIPLANPPKFFFNNCIIENFIIKTNKLYMDLVVQKNTFLENLRIADVEFLQNFYFSDNIFKNSFSFCANKICKNFVLRQPFHSRGLITIEKSNFEGEVSFYGGQFEDFVILNSTFQKNVFFGIDKQKQNTQGFGNSVFEEYLHIDNCIFNDNVYFERCYFKLLALESSIFNNNVFFDNAIFNEARISKTTFLQRTSFYHAIFCQPPLFINCIFDKYLTMVGAKLDLNGRDLIDFIVKQAQQLSDLHNQIMVGKIVKTNDEKNQSDFINDYRDGFCTIKNALIKNNNLLDASNYHKAELYCKEIELDSKPQKSWRDWIDWAQLFFYRNTSDHHTDLLKIIGWVLTTIACFGVLLGSLKYGLDFEKFAKNHQLEFLPNIFSTIAMWFHTDIRHICAWLYDLFFVSLIFSFSRFFSSLMVVCLIIAIQPKYILGLGGLIGGSIQMQGMAEKFLFVLYSILMFLMLFSLQKTARKNSIIPS